jgi:flagellar motor switch protein FliG
MAKAKTKPLPKPTRGRPVDEEEESEEYVGGPGRGVQPRGGRGPGAARGGRGAGVRKALTGRQKAAVFVISLGHEVAAEIFKHMREDEIEQLTFEIARNESVDSETRDRVLMEFQELMMAQDFIQSGGIEYARELLEKSLGSQKAVDIINRLTSSLQVRPFDFIRRTDPAHLLNFIQGEHPQTIALILSYLEAKNAALVLGGLEPEVQANVAKRIAEMERTLPETLREVERVLEKNLSTIASEDYAIAGGIDSIVEIMGVVDRTTEKQILEALEEEDPELAEEIKKRMLVFEDIVLLNDRDIQKVLRSVDSPELAKALKGVEAEVQDKVFRNMSKRAATLLREDMEYMGPVRLKDVEEAQQKIVSVIRKLEEQGEVVIARAGEEEMVV